MQGLKFNNETEKELFNKTCNSILMWVYLSRKILEWFTSNELSGYILMITNKLMKKQFETFLQEENH